MNIAVVTSVWGDYGRFLPDWLASIEAQETLPARVTILDAGLDDPAAIRKLAESSDLDVQVATMRYRGMGAARNAAVAATRSTEWVMHLDADDVLLPHAISDAAELAHSADVISIGAWRDGRPRIFPQVQRRTILRGALGCFSCSPFRRRLWEHRPWIETNDFVDSPLWAGFAHDGARFKGTSRPGFVYRQHPDSFSHRLTDEQRDMARQQLKQLCRQWR